MTDPLGPSQPLKILTLDGGGLQAISTLLILNKLLEKIAQESGVPACRKPRPCDVFDTIAGIGAGGWLAILLGRFRMDITTCLSEWYEIMQCIAPKSKTEELRLRLLRHCYFDTERLVERVDSLTRTHGTGDRLFHPYTSGARTRHVFVAALTSDAKGYSLFRSYEIPDSAKLPEKLLEGPKDPSNFEIRRAFGVTGAARYFSNPWEEEMASSGKTSFNDTKFPKPHNITRLALDEMWGIYGSDVPLSVVVNIGPGLPTDSDVKQIARRFPWGLKPYPPLEATPTREARSLIVPNSPTDSVEQDIKRTQDGSHDHLPEQPQLNKHSPEGSRNRSAAPTKPFASVKDRGIDAELKRLEDDIEIDIKNNLSNICPGTSNLYYRLAPAQAPQGTPQNDFSTSGVALNATMAYLSEPPVDATMNEIVKRILGLVSDS
ncbi:hypothetical protein IMSHALPRED_010378 [Imshaugia aleurites]|uniref:PNPLA domain-containing protein n=1 Tax=Imshaugia aleurites TaxID=172621 RepID=A0A8H3IWQ9_9LECA|nr:hypothetical protein IMSHALPRED_010378 [Imshaugia aleurites]